MENSSRRQGKRVVVTGATGNVGTSVVPALAAEPDIGAVLGPARRTPAFEIRKVEWDTLDLSRPDSEDRLAGPLHGARAVAALIRTVLSAAWRAHAVPASPRLFDAVLRLPVLDSTRAYEVLGRQPTRTAQDALSAFLCGVPTGAGGNTAPMAGRKIG